MPMAQLGQPQLSNVRNPVDDPEHVQIHMHVDPKYVGAVVGKQGATIKETASCTQCNLSISDKGVNPRRVVITGRYENAVGAQSAVFDQLREAARAEGGNEPTDVTVVFLIRFEVAGAVVGKQGATIQSIR